MIMNSDPDRAGKKEAVAYFKLLFQKLERLRKPMLNISQEYIKINMLT
jgi:hypothetical protein